MSKDLRELKELNLLYKSQLGGVYFSKKFPEILNNLNTSMVTRVTGKIGKFNLENDYSKQLAKNYVNQEKESTVEKKSRFMKRLDELDNNEINLKSRKRMSRSIAVIEENKKDDFLENLNTKSNFLTKNTFLSNNLNEKTKSNNAPSKHSETSNKLKIQTVDNIEIEGNQISNQKQRNSPQKGLVNDFCPFCNHCNQMKEEKNFEEIISAVKKSKSVISSIFDFISKEFEDNDKNDLDFFEIKKAISSKNDKLNKKNDLLAKDKINKDKSINISNMSEKNLKSDESMKSIASNVKYNKKKLNPIKRNGFKSPNHFKMSFFDKRKKKNDRSKENIKEEGNMTKSNMNISFSGRNMEMMLENEIQNEKNTKMKNESNKMIKRANELCRSYKKEVKVKRRIDLLQAESEDIKTIEGLLNRVPKTVFTPNNIEYKLVGSYLSSLLDNKLEIDDIVNYSTLQKIKKTFLSIGKMFLFFKDSDDNENDIYADKFTLSNLGVIFDSDLIIHLDMRSKINLIKVLNEQKKQDDSEKRIMGVTNKSGFVKLNENNTKESRKVVSQENNETNSNNSKSKEKNNLYHLNENEEDAYNEFIDANLTYKDFEIFKEKYFEMENSSNAQEEINIKQSIKYSLLLYCVIVYIISELSTISKERSILLYKAFKLYFIEQEKKNFSLKEKLLRKIKYYKNFIDFILNHNKTYFYDLDKVNDILLSTKVNKKNLAHHKEIIKVLFKLVNEQREKMYLLENDISNMEKELKTWIYDWDRVKRAKIFKDKLKELDIHKIAKNIQTELGHKKISEEEKSILANSQRFLLISSQSDYYEEQKAFMISEIQRLRGLFEEASQETIAEKNKAKDEIGYLNKQIIGLQNQIIDLKNKLRVETNSIAVQTEVDFVKFNKMLRDHETLIYLKSLNKNKFETSLERVKYQISQAKPLEKKAVLYFISELYIEKVNSNMRKELENKKKEFFDVFFYNYMKDKFKIDKIVRNHIESVIFGILMYSLEDTRIDAFGKFLGIGTKYRKEVLDIFLIFLYNLPVSMDTIFSKDYDNILINGEDVFEIYFNNLYQYKFVYSLKYNILRLLKIFINGKDTKLASIGILMAGKTQKSFMVSNKKLNVTNNTNFNLNEEQLKLDILMLVKFIHRSAIKIDQMYSDYSQGKNYFPLSELTHQFSLVNKEFEMTVKETEELFDRHFVCEKNLLLIESFVEYFQNKKITFKIKLKDFIEITLEKLVQLFNGMEDYIFKSYNSIDVANEGFLNSRNFEKAIKKISYINDKNNWKISKYFMKALGESERDVLSKEEFIVFCLNEMDLVISLVGKVKLGGNNQQLELDEKRKSALLKCITFVEDKLNNLMMFRLKTTYNYIAKIEGYPELKVPIIDDFLNIIQINVPNENEKGKEKEREKEKEINKEKIKI